MKHAAILYTCVGLMGAAAVAGFADYSHASKAGLLTGLYHEEQQVTGTMLPPKKLELDDYSRAPLAYEAMEDSLPTVKEQKQRTKKTPPAPPKPPKPEKEAVVASEEIMTPPPPPPSPAVESPALPAPPEAVIEPEEIAEMEKVPTTPPPVKKAAPVKRVTRKMFSRAPLYEEEEEKIIVSKKNRKQ